MADGPPEQDLEAARLEERHHTRLRPAMYIYNTGTEGLVSCVEYLVEDAAAASREGLCTRIDVILHEDGSLSVEDDGPGYSGEGSPSPLEGAVLSRRMRSFHSQRPVVFHLSEWSRIESRRDGRSWTMELRDGAREVNGPTDAGATELHGLRVHTMPDWTIFTVKAFDFEAVRERLRVMALCNAGLTITLEDRRPHPPHSPTTAEFKYTKAAVERLEELVPGLLAAEDGVVSASGKLLLGTREVEFDIALKENGGGLHRQELYVYDILARDGGTALDAAIAGYAESVAAQQKPKSEDAAAFGATMALNIAVVLILRIPSPSFAGSNKTRLINRELVPLMRGIAFAAAWKGSW